MTIRPFRRSNFSLSLRLRSKELNLATKVNSLPSFSKLTVLHHNISRILREQTPAYDRLISGSFHPLLWELFSFTSRYYFAIGLEEYLELGVFDSHLPTGYSTNRTRDTWHIPFYLRLRGYHPLWHLFPENFNLIN